MATNGTTPANNGIISAITGKKFDPKFPAAAEVKAIFDEIPIATQKSLERVANLSIPVLGQTAKSESLDSAIQAMLTHGKTISLFGDLFARLQSGNLTRDEVDQKLVNWALEVPGIQEKFDELPSDVRELLEEYRGADLSALDDVKSKADNFKMQPSLPTQKKMGVLRDSWTANTEQNKYTSVVEADGTPVMYAENEIFENWGQTVKNKPAVTFIPKTVVGVQNIVKYAKEQKKSVRCSGYRHSWSELFSSDDEILVSMLPIDVAVDLPSFQGSWAPGEGKLQQIKVIPESAAADGSTICAKIGTATTNERFREWCVDPNGGNVMWTLPLNVIMVEITFGGSVSPICHGAGLKHKTLSDLVVEVEYVDCNGNLHTVSDPDLLKSAAGAFGLLGVVTAYTLRLDKMTYTSMRPHQVPIELAIPPPQEYIDASRKGDPKYKWIKDLMAQYNQETIDKALQDFIASVETNYYVEWFWFPLQRNVWVNTWNNTGVKAQSSEIPSKWDTFLQWFEEWLAETINNWVIWQALPGELQAKLLGFVTLLQLPNVSESDPPLVTELINGLHFRRGIQNMRVMDMEWELEITPLPSAAQTPKTEPESKTKERKTIRQRLSSSGPPKTTNGSTENLAAATSSAPTNDAPTSDEPAASEEITAITTSAPVETTPAPKRDWTITQKAWWDAVLLMQSDPSKVRVALEMRIMGGSDVHLAPMRGYNLGTTSIEILTTPNTVPADWLPFCQKLTDIWLNYRDRSTGNRVKARPHWCKQWSFLNMPDDKGFPTPARDWIRQVAYKDEIPLFIAGLKKIAETQGFTMEEMRARFSNPLLEKCIFGVGSDAEPAVVKPSVSRRCIAAIQKFFRNIFS